MNVQQINNTGNNIWVFIVTAVCLTGAAVLVWLFPVFELKWRKRNQTSYLSRSTRLGYIMWLFTHPVLWKDTARGTLLGILTNGRFGNEEAMFDIDRSRTRIESRHDQQPVDPSESSL